MPKLVTVSQQCAGLGCSKQKQSAATGSDGKVYCSQDGFPHGIVLAVPVSQHCAQPRALLTNRQVENNAVREAVLGAVFLAVRACCSRLLLLAAAQTRALQTYRQVENNAEREAVLGAVFLAVRACCTRMLWLAAAQPPCIKQKQASATGSDDGNM